MNTVFLLMAQYNGQAIIPLERVCADYFSHLTPEKNEAQGRRRPNRLNTGANGEEPEVRARRPSV
ncbi:pyocin activator PrtN family protein [Pseudomonas lini]